MLKSQDPFPSEAKAKLLIPEPLDLSNPEACQEQLYALLTNYVLLEAVEDIYFAINPQEHPVRNFTTLYE